MPARKQQRNARPKRQNQARRPRRNRMTRVSRPVFAPAAVGRVDTGRGNSLPKVSQRGRSMVVSHRERFATVAPTTTAFQVESYFVNPGLPNCFPWLCDVANRFEKYKFQSLRFRYVPQCDTQAGLVTLAFDFDPEDYSPDTMAIAATYSDHASASVWHEVTMSADLADGDRLPQKNVRAGNPGAYNLNMYDVGQLHVCTEGAAAGTVGYVEVEYTVSLFLHQTSGGVGGRALATGSLDSTHFVGTDFAIDPQAFLPVVESDTATVVFTQPFEGVLTLFVEGTGMSGAVTYTLTGSGSTSAAKSTVSATSVTTFVPVRAYCGDTLTVSVTTATTVSKVYWYFAKARYRALEG